jgi:hypothetical protein
MPADFSTITVDKIHSDKNDRIEGLSRAESVDLVKRIHSGIDDILKSGKVTYGDPLSDYVTKVGNKLTEHNPDLGHLRFYMLRSNVVNALSTKQGIIFVTQGLIAQLENEAQLAFILAHEMVHYEHDHVVQGYKDHREVSRTQRRNEEKFKKLSYYSREKEFEADSVAVGIYCNAGYSKEELYNVFDVLAYSYLPFELEDLPVDFLNSDNLYIPEEYFTAEIPDISTDEDYDDSKSSHPNIKQRKDQVASVVERQSNWKDYRYLVSEEEFLTVRELARFESIRNDLYNFRYIDALYSIYMLEKQHPDNLYLNRGKAKAWAGMMAAKSDSKNKWRPISPKKIQGPSHQFHHLIKALSTEQLYSVGLRIIYDAKQKFPEDNELRAVFDYAVAGLANDEKKFDKNGYKEMNYFEALNEFNKSKELLTDSLANLKDSVVAEEKLSKYQKIRKDKESVSTAKSVDDEFSTDVFHLYALKGILNDKDFKDSYARAVQKIEKDKKEKDEKSELSYTQKQKRNKIEEDNQFRLGIESVMLLESHAVKYTPSGNMNYDKSHRLELKLQDVVKSTGMNNSVDVHSVSTSEYVNKGTNIYNERAVLLNGIYQMSEYPGARLFPVDYSLQNELMTNYQTSKVAFAMVEGSTDLSRLRYMFFYILMPPALIYDAPFRIRGLNSTDFGLAVFDFEEFNLVGYKRYTIPGFTSKAKMEVVMYDFMFNLSSLPK